jgi:hypothetical protein
MEVNNSKKVLLVSFSFPPDNSIGAVRIGKFAKYLPEFGWEPVVLTIEGIKGLPKTLALEIEEKQVVRVPYYSIYNLMTKRTHVIDTSAAGLNRQDSNRNNKLRHFTLRVLSPFRSFYTLPIIEKAISEPIGWYRPAVQASRKILQRQKVNIVFSSIYPLTSHFIASQICGMCKIPWVAEFRDPWSFNAYLRKTQPLHFLDQQWEKHTMRNCAQLITVSDIWAREMEELHRKNVLVIPNGFDESDFKGAVSILPKFTITYTGNIYPGKRDPSPLFQAISELKNEEIISGQNFEIRFFGRNVHETLPALISQYGIKDIVKMGGNISYQESIKSQRESTVLLLLSWNDAQDSGTLTAKIYEYLGAGRPALAVAFKGGEIDKLLKETQSGIVANSASEIKAIILNWFEEFKTTGKINTHFYPLNDVIKKYTRREQAKSLAAVFDKYAH